MTKLTSTERHRQIIDAALRCFAEHGVEGTTIDMIRAASGASVGSLYHRFGNKEGIAAEVYITGLRDFRARLQQATDAATTVREAVTAIVGANIDWISAHPDWARFVFNHRVVLSQADREAEFSAEVADANKRLWQRFYSLPGAGTLSSRDSGLHNSLLAGPVHDYARQWLEGRRKRSPAALRDMFIHAAWGAMQACGATEQD